MKRDTFVYWLFDDSGECLYVGITRKPERRWQQHCWQKPQMVDRVAHKRMAGPFTAQAARQLEREQQDDLQPIYDVVQARMRSRARSLPKAPTKWTGGFPTEADRRRHLGVIS